MRKMYVGDGKRLMYCRARGCGQITRKYRYCTQCRKTKGNELR